MFRRDKRYAFFHPDRGLQRAYGTATAMASGRNPDLAQGTDSLDLLVAAIAAKPVGQLLRRLDLDGDAIVQRATAARVPVAEPGLTPDAKRVVEAVGHRSLDRRRNATPLDLLVALAGVPGPAKAVLIGVGLNEARLAALVE
jgi:hypothetical protein